MDVCIDRCKDQGRPLIFEEKKYCSNQCVDLNKMDFSVNITIEHLAFKLEVIYLLYTPSVP